MAKPQTNQNGEFTYANYLKWPPRPRYELLNGHARMMAPPSTAHQRVVFELSRQIGNALQGKPCQGFAGPVGVRLPVRDEADEFIQTVFEPDLLIVCDASKVNAKGIRGAPDFVIEVLSPSTAAYDSIEKTAAYERAGVRELWLIDIGGAKIYRYLRTNIAFAAPEALAAEGRIELHLGFALELDFMAQLSEGD
jgi:Uma2 family endonuclease